MCVRILMAYNVTVFDVVVYPLLEMQPHRVYRTPETIVQVMDMSML